MVTMLPSYWHSVTVLALVVIVSTNITLVSSYCSDQRDFCIAENRLDRIEREVVLKGRQERGNELDRTFRDSLRRDINTLDRIRQTETNRFDRVDSQSRLRRNIRLSRQDQRRIEFDEQNNRESVNRFDERQLKSRNYRLSQQIEQNQNRNNLRRSEIRNDIGRKSSSVVLREELTRLERVREDRRVNNQRVRDERVYELRERSGDRVREERVREEEVREERVREVRKRMERVREDRVLEERVQEERARRETVREERVSEDRAREMRLLKRHEPIREARQQQGAERIRDTNVRNELKGITLNREEFTRILLPDRSYNTRNYEMEGNTRRERMSDINVYRRIRVESSQRSSNDRRGIQRIVVASENRNEQRHQQRLADDAERQIRSSEERRELEDRLSINYNIENRDDSRKIESRRDTSSRMDTSSRRDIVNYNEERENHYSDRLSAFYNDYRRETSLKEFGQLNSPQLSWNFCQAVLIGAIVLQIIKFKDGTNKSKSFSAFTNYLPLMSPNHVKAL